METYKFERLPPVSIEFLRIVHWVVEARIFCRSCHADTVVSLDKLGLPEDTPFPPTGSIGTCGACGANDVTAEPVFPEQSDQKPKSSVTPDPAQNVEEAPASDIRDALDKVTANLGSARLAQKASSAGTLDSIAARTLDACVEHSQAYAATRPSTRDT